MRYFELLNLRREPFSNSPDPDLFYRTKQHRECLQALEIAIRLKRGLSVVTGHVGTGKTTLCRQLIRVLGDRQGVDTHLILDPSFSGEREFLVHINGLFGVPQEEALRASDWELRENIKAALFRLAVEEDRLVVLIVDEGQKMSLECLELLRELLNYETNEHKLLQIVIFGQLEFEPILEAKANLADRVNLRFRIGPLDFQDTRELIQARLAMCSKDISPEGLFSFWALLGVYLATDGFPRQIVQLCHQALLAVIIKERPRVTWGVVRSCMRWRTLGVPRRRRWPRILAAGLALAVLLTGAGLYFAVSPGELGRAGQAARMVGLPDPSKWLASVSSWFKGPERTGSLSSPAAEPEPAAPGGKPGVSAPQAEKAASGQTGSEMNQAPAPQAALAAPAAPGPDKVQAPTVASQEPKSPAKEQPGPAAPQPPASNTSETPPPPAREAASGPMTENDAPAAPEDGVPPVNPAPCPCFMGVLVAPGAESDSVEILTAMPVERFEQSFRPGPARVLVDIAGQWERKAGRELQVGSARIDKVRNAVHPDKLRVAIYLKDASAGTVQPLVEKTPRGLRVILK
ncbi:MAG: AAA family ATPase [Thermodesulfobacteriota bacterium]